MSQKPQPGIAWHAPTPPTVNEHGDETHPAYAMIRAVRSTGGGGVLFDSDVQHQHTVRIEVTTATRKRDLNSDWIHPSIRTMLEVEVSEAQWAGFVSSVNTQGVPCTLRRTETEPNVPGLVFEPRLRHSLGEARGAADRAFAKIQQAMQALDDLDPKAGVKARREAMSSLRAAIANASGNVEFAAKSLGEHAENVVQKARADVEAMVVAKAAQLGVSAAELGTLAIGPDRDDEMPAITE